MREERVQQLGDLYTRARHAFVRLVSAAFALLGGAIVGIMVWIVFLEGEYSLVGSLVMMALMLSVGGMFVWGGIVGIRDPERVRVGVGGDRR